MSELRAALGVIGGTGFYQLLDHAEPLTVDTPYGTVADRVRVGHIGETTVAFLPRHGADHSVPPHRINYRANIWALHSLGVRQILAPCAVGSLNREFGPGAIVLPDQLVDRTTGRAQTYFEDGGSHIPFADPYCDNGSRIVAAAAAATGETVHRGGAMVVIDGPRFSTRAESKYYTAQGWDLINMTGHPEAVLARELGICYNALALVTDYDAGVDAAESVNQDAVYDMFAKNLDRLRSLVLASVTRLTRTDTCVCVTTRGGLPLPPGA
jgi:5'-methylthioadenosine phosphorylase